MSKKVLKIFLKATGFNLLAGAIGILPLVFLRDAAVWGIILLLLALLSLFIQLVAALIFLGDPAKKETGQGMLLTVGLFLLIGLGICGPMWLGY